MRQFSVLVLIVLVIGCGATRQQEAMQSISLGITKDDVLTRLGTPDQEWTAADMVIMRYDIPTSDTGKTLQCMGAGLNGQYLPGCDSESYNVSYFVQIKDNKVAGYGRTDNRTSSEMQSFSNTPYTPPVQGYDKDLLSPEPASPEPSLENFACKDAIRRYKLGTVSINQMENACQ